MHLVQQDANWRSEASARKTCRMDPPVLVTVDTGSMFMSVPRASFFRSIESRAHESFDQLVDAERWTGFP